MGMSENEAEWLLSLRDEATATFAAHADNVKRGAADIKESIQGASAAIDTHGKVVDRLREYYVGARAEQREQMFFFRQGKDRV